MDDHHELLILGLIVDSPCLYLCELSELIFDATGVRVSGSTVCSLMMKWIHSQESAAGSKAEVYGVSSIVHGQGIGL